jgi:glycosyltransferase involved in cell wall biosynthesis/Tfp pilus assembly protein PilF
MARTLSALPDCLCLHEPAPELIKESSDYRSGKLDREILTKLFLKTRQPVLKGKVYGESNQTLSLIIPALIEAFPAARFVWLIRNGMDVVASTYSRQWYTGHSANHNRYEDCPPLEKAWIDGRIMGDFCGDVPKHRWDDMNPFARCCWYWAYVNRTIEQDLMCLSPARYKTIRLEEIDNHLPELIDWLGFEPVSELKIGRHNRAHYDLHHWRKWSDEEIKTFLYWCSPMMDRLYPKWRNENLEWLNRVYPCDNRKSSQAERLQNQRVESILEKPAKTPDCESRIYFTPDRSAKLKVSVYITSYNQKKFLTQAIESVLNQTLKPDQIIIVDDCSTDGSQKIIDRYERQHPDLIQTVYHETNLGVVKTRIDALQRVTGDYVTYLDGDDRFLPTKLEKEASLFGKRNDIHIVYSNNYYMDATGKKIGVWVEDQLPPEGRVFCHTFGRDFPKKSLFRMELINFQALKAVGFHDPHLSIYEDFDLRIRLSKHFSVAYCNEPLSEIRLHGTGLSSSKTGQHLASLDYLFRKNVPLLMDLPEDERKDVEERFNDWAGKISLRTDVGRTETNKRQSERRKTFSRPGPSTSRIGKLGAGLIFIISQPRAGSTLLQRMLYGHPDIHTTAEPWVMLHPLYALKHKGILTEYDSSLASAAVQDFLNSVPEGPEVYTDAIREMAGVLYNRVLEHSGKKLFVDKTPRYYHVIPQLYKIFPEAKFVFLLRNPLAVLSSILNTWFHNETQKITPPIFKDLLEGPMLLIDGMRILREDAIIVDYERLVKQPAQVVRHVCHRIGIGFFPKMLEYGRNARPKGQFGDPIGIYKHDRPVDHYIEKWVGNLSTPELNRFAKRYFDILGRQVFNHLGYSYAESLKMLGWNQPQNISRLQDRDELIRRGEKLYADGKIDDALNIFEKALVDNDNDARIHNNLGVIYHASGKIEEALKSYQNAIRLDPHNINYQKNLADFLFFANGAVESALSIYNQVLQEHPTDIDTMMNIGRICEILGKNDDAKDFYLQALNFDPQNAQAQQLFKLVSEKGGNKYPVSRSLKGNGRNLESKLPANTGEILVSAIVSTYNSERFIRGCLDDLESQTIAEYLEIIVVDSGSEENEKAIVQEYMARYGNIKYIRTKRRENVYAAWNRGIKATTGKYVTSANTDDRHRRDAFDVMARALEEHPEVSLVYANLIITETENETFDKCTPVGTFLWLDWDRDDLLNKGCFMGPQPMWRRDVHDEYGYFDDRFVTSGDYEFWLRISQTRRFLHLPSFLGLYLRAENSIEHRNQNQKYIENKKIIKLYADAKRSQKVINRCADFESSVSDAKHGPEAETKNLDANQNFPFSIILYVSGRKKEIEENLSKIRKYTPEAHEIIFVGRKSDKHSIKWLEQRVGSKAPCRMLSSREKSSQINDINKALELAAGEYVVLLSSRASVFNGWLDGLRNCLKSVPNTGIVGPMTNAAANSKQHVTFSHAINRDIEKFAESFKSRNRHRRIPADWIEGSCLLFSKRLIDGIGYLDESFYAMAAAVKDYCVRAALGGFENLIAGDVFVYRPEEVASDSAHEEFMHKWVVTESGSRKAKQYLALKLLNKGATAYARGRLDEAVEYMLNAIGYSPNDGRAYCRLAEMLIDARHFKEALDVLSEMPSGSTADKKNELMGYCLEGLDRVEEAKCIVSQQGSTGHISPGVLNLRGLIAYKEGDVESARKNFEQAISVDPGHGEPYSSLGVLKTKDSPEEAFRLFEKAFILAPTVSSTVANFHSALTAAALFERGERLFAEAAAIFPDNRNLAYKLIDIYIQQEKYTAAMAAIENAMTKFGVNAGFLAGALRVRENVGHFDTLKQAPDNASISLCMIVKNEEDYLASCLHSIKPIVDEMIVVDTGSTDHTRDIARAFGAKVFDFAWEDDFSAARNFSLSKAKGDWILVMDADEVISSRDHKHFKAMSARRLSKPTAYSIVTRNYCINSNAVGWVPNNGKYGDQEAGLGWLPSKKVRLFRAQDQVRFEGAVHEMVEPVLKRNGITISACTIPVHHYGRLNKDRLDQKGRSYFEIGCKKLESRGEDPDAVRELAVQATELELNDEAIGLWEKFLALKPGKLSAAEAYINMATVFIRRKNFDLAVKAAKNAVKVGPDIKEAHYNQAVAELYWGNASESARILASLLRRFPAYPPARFFLVMARCCAGDQKRAIEELAKLKCEPFGPGLVYTCIELCERLFEADKIEFAVMILQTAIKAEITNRELLDLYERVVKTLEESKDTAHPSFRYATPANFKVPAEFN